jgi:hypothetical protein
VPQGATPVTLRMQALTAARFDDILAHVSFACHFCNWLNIFCNRPFQLGWGVSHQQDGVTE